MTPQKIPPPIRVYGGEYRGKCPKESVEQSSFFNRVRREYPDTWGRLAVHIRNEGLVEKGQFQAIVKHRMEGMVAGAADIVIPGAPAFVCEMKRTDPTKSEWGPGQEDYLIAAQAVGSFACVAFGAVAAWQAFEEWLGVQANITPTPA